jgi:hypothetical protein
MAKSCLPGIYIYLFIYLSFLLGLASIGISNTLKFIDGIFSYYRAYIKVYRFWPLGIIHLCPANKLPSVGEASDC